MNSAAEKKKFKILIIDDTRTDRDVFTYVLGQAGFAVESAMEGEQGLAKLAEGDFDLVLCDYLMPKMDGLQFLTRLRQDSRLAHIIAIIITSDENEDTKVKLLRAGANDFIHKGVCYDEIIARIRVHLDAQASHGHRKVLELAGEIAHQINQPLSAIVIALDVLGRKMKTELAAKQRTEYLDLLKNISVETEVLMKLSSDLKNLRMDLRKHYKYDKPTKY